LNSRLRTCLVLLLLATVGAALDVAFDARARALVTTGGAPDEIALAVARAHRGPLLWIDARSDAEFARDHIPEALALDPARWETGIRAVLRAWQPGTRVIVYCRAAGCGTSRNVADRLRRDYGLTDVWVLRGGWEAWQEAVRR